MIKMFFDMCEGVGLDHGEGVVRGLVGVENPLPGLDLIILAFVRSGPMETLLFLSGLSYLCRLTQK